MAYCAKKEKVASKCLVICIGISKYAPETNIPDISDVCEDIQAYKSTFSRNANYTLICNDIARTYSKKELLDYFQLLFDENLYDSSTHEIKYNALLVTVSGHCTENSLIASDGRKIPFIQILSILTESFKNKSLITNLPKFIFIDGQRGYDYIANDEQKDGNGNDDIAYIEAQMMGGEDEYITDTYSAIICSVSTVLTSTVISGQLAWNLTQILSENMNKNTDMLFYDIIKQLKHRINAALGSDSGYQFMIDFIEHDLDIDDVVFSAVSTHKIKKNKKKYAFKRSQSLGNILNLKNKKSDHKKEKKAKKKKEKKSVGLSPRRFFKRTQSLTVSFNGKRSKSQPPPTEQKQMTCAFPENEEINDIVKDAMFAETIEWEKSLEILSKTKDKTRVRVHWLFVVSGVSHSVSLLHSQKLHNPYLKSKRVLLIDNKQIWQQKSTQTQFIEMFEANVLQINIKFEENKKDFYYELTVNNCTHKQLYQAWLHKQTKQMYVE